MSVTIQVSQIIDRPVAAVFNFHAREHVRNHPRWDPNMQLDQVTPGPIGVGTIINRINSRSGSPIEGTMEVVEYEPDRTMGMVIQDGPVTMKGRVNYEADGDERTILRLYLEFPDMDEGADTSMIESSMQQSLDNIKRLIESEV